MHAAKVYHQSTAEPRNVSIILQPKASHLQIANYSLRPKINVVLAFKFCPTKSAVLACNEIHLIKAIPNTKKTLYRKMYRANQIHSVGQSQWECYRSVMDIKFANMYQ